jgi:hypothetical protein
VAISPDQSPKAAFSFVPGYAGQPTVFDASPSSTPVGAIVQYHWDFGDGETATTTVPLVEHVYQRPGAYAPMSRVTNSAGTSTEQVFTGQTMMRNGGPAAETMQHLDIPAVPCPKVIARALPSGPLDMRWNEAADVNGDLVIDRTDLRLAIGARKYCIP